MPQRVVIIYSCSLCRAEFDSAEKVTPYKLSGGGKVLDFDFCATCEITHEGLQALFGAGIQDRKAKASTPALPPPATIPCELCEESFTPKGMGLHQSKIHGVKSATTAKEEASGKGPHKCPECEFGARAPQGLAAHRSRAHGVPANPTGRVRK